MQVISATAPVIERKFAGEPIASVKVLDGAILIETAKHALQLFPEGTSIVVEKRLFAGIEKVYDTASYDKDGTLRSVALGRRNVMPGGTFKIVREDGSFEMLDPSVEPDEMMREVVRSNGRRIWHEFQFLEPQLKELRNHPAITVQLSRRQD